MPGRLESQPIPRRDFLGLSGLWATGIAICGSLIGILKLPMPRVTPEAGSRFRIGRPEEFPAGTERILADRNVMIRSANSGVAALSLICTHLGCAVIRTPAGFHCPCHGSTFDRRGVVNGGPAPRGLRWLEVSRAADGKLVVDAGREVDPGTFYPVAGTSQRG